MPSEVFICHSAKDEPAANEVCAALEAEGFTCWIAPRDVRIGASWAEAIAEAIDTSKVMVILISSDTINSPKQVTREIELADTRNTALLPFFIESVALSKGLKYYLKDRQWIDASTPPLKSHMPRLVGAVRELLTGVPQPPPPPPPPPKPWRWPVIGVAAMLIVAFSIMAYRRDFFFGGGKNDNKSAAATPSVTPTAHAATPTVSPPSNDSRQGPVPAVTSKPTVAPTLAAPEPIEPRCDTVFAWSNQTLSFSWSRVAGASTYTLEWDCFRCASHPSGWYSQLGRPWMLREGVGLRSPIYTTQDVYDRLKRERARAFRWRIWAVDQDLVNGKKSAWCQLAFAGNLQVEPG